MSDLGSSLSKMFGDYKTVEVVAPKKNDDIQCSLEHYRSPTTNSYNKCLDHLMDKFPVGVIEIARRALDRHDQNDFNESIDLGEVYKFNEDTGEQYLAGRNLLKMIGKYQFKFFAHCKTIEMWLEFKKQ